MLWPQLQGEEVLWWHAKLAVASAAPGNSNRTNVKETFYYITEPSSNNNNNNNNNNKAPYRCGAVVGRIY
jgi:hypothetical protein